jgi:GTP-binding protein
VYVEAHANVQTLNVTNLVKGKDGGSGKGSDLNGKAGKDSTIKVPLGSVLSENGQVVVDLDTPQTYLVASGGKYGRGNKECPQLTAAEHGLPGELRQLIFELKLIADIGFVGFPNAGKTSLLASLTRACPKIASYPFTTLRPYVGILEFTDGLRLSIADMPGLIEGAHLNKGLGHEFLKHIMRTKGLLYVLDATDSPLDRFSALYDELRLFDKELINKPYSIVLNKADIIQDRSEIDALKLSLGTDVLEISAKHATNLSPLVVSLRELVERTRTLELVA